MQPSAPPALLVLLASSVSVSAASLMLDFGATPAADPFLARSPGHETGAIALTETAWNTITSSASRSDLVTSSGTAASGVTLALGQEATGGSNVISFATAITNLGLAGTGGAVPGHQSLLTAGSIYGENTASTAVGRDGFFGGGTATGTGAAIGLRLDGLAAGAYAVYVMSRNTNSNASSYPMHVVATTGAPAGTFDFATLSRLIQSNNGYAAATYSGEYGAFLEGQNYVAATVTLAAGESLYIAADGGSDSIDRRGFLNAVQIVPIPEPSVALLGALGLLALAFRRR
jgi:hypothetical protein